MDDATRAQQGMENLSVDAASGGGPVVASALQLMHVPCMHTVLGAHQAGSV